MLEQILSAIISLATPGYSDMSRIQVRDCDQRCREQIEILTGTEVRESYSGYRSKWILPSRVETRIEALRRYSVIAIAVESVVRDPPPAWRPRWDPGDLWRGLVTIGRQESAFWRSVHEGRVRGQAGEWCLAQIHPAVLPLLGFEGPDLVGVDLAATARCFRVAAELLGRARALCEGEPGFWFAPTIAAYGSGQGCSTDHDWIRVRTETYDRITTTWPLPHDAVIVLELETRRFVPRVPDWCGSAGCRYTAGFEPDPALGSNGP